MTRALAVVNFQVLFVLGKTVAWTKLGEQRMPTFSIVLSKDNTMFTKGLGRQWFEGWVPVPGCLPPVRCDKGPYLYIQSLVQVCNENYHNVQNKPVLRSMAHWFLPTKLQEGLKKQLKPYSETSDKYETCLPLGIWLISLPWFKNQQ